MYPSTGETMEPRLNIKVAELFDKTAFAPNPDDNFVAPDAQGRYPQDLGNFVDEDSNHFEKNMQAYMEQREGLGGQIQRYVDEGMQGNDLSNPAQDRALMVMEPEVAGTGDLQLAPALASKKFASQIKGFRTDQARPDFTMGLVANAKSGSIVSARVVAETPSTKIAGTVIAVGDREFAVIWDDKTASVERKSDYELVIAQ